MTDNGFVCNRLGTGHQFGTTTCPACHPLGLDVTVSRDSLLESRNKFTMFQEEFTPMTQPNECSLYQIHNPLKVPDPNDPMGRYLTWACCGKEAWVGNRIYLYPAEYEVVHNELQEKDTMNEDDLKALQRLRLARRNTDKREREFDRAQRRYHKAVAKNHRAYEAVEERGLDPDDPRARDE